MIFSIFYVVVFAHADFYMHINVSLMYACGFHGNDSSLFFFFLLPVLLKLNYFSFFPEQACLPLCFPEMTSVSGASSENASEW